MPIVYKNQKVITVSKSSKKDIAKLGSIKEENIEIVTPGIDLKDFKKTKKTPYPSFIYLGRLKPYKNIDTAINAFAKVVKKHKDAKFLIVGDGESSDDLKEMTLKLGLTKNIEFTGRVNHKQKVELLGKCWVSIQPSSFEGWGITVIEANACATPVVASKVKGLQDSVVHGKTGILVPAKDPNSLAKTMEKLITEQKVRTQLSNHAHAWAQNFSWDESASKFKSTIGRYFEHLQIRASALESV
jgi:glycosyltransferase involved in cell wall biosynthesis